MERIALMESKCGHAMILFQLISGIQEDQYQQNI